MFETAVVQARSGDRRFGFLSLSVAVHTAAVAAVIAASVASTTLPIEAPKQMMPVYLAIPPALGTPDPAPRPKPSPVTTAAAPPLIITAPSTIPVTLTPATEVTGTGTGDTTVGVPWGSDTGMGTDVPPAPDAAGPLVIKGDIKAPMIIRRVEPLYPRLALQARMNGTVVLQCVIDKAGHIRDVRVVTSTFGAFEQPAIDAVQQWLFAPGTLNGQAVDTIFELTVRFQVK
ncbi:MAG TPA: TonB family protein [Thermoanaerobaculia bacterium]